MIIIANYTYYLEHIHKQEMLMLLSTLIHNVPFVVSPSTAAYRIESLHLPVNPLTAAVVWDTIKDTLSK